jgi:AmiR/NasT family two-component response regulator
MAGESIRVVLAEDDAMVAALTATDLVAAGLTVAGVARNGEEAVAMTASLGPDAVVMDIRMPGMDGIAAADAIQRRCPTPVVMLTAFDAQALVEDSALAGVGAFITKPSSPAEILRAVTVARARFADLMQLRALNAALRAALDEVKTLRGLLPICANCKRVRDGDGDWHTVEIYVRDHSEAEFTHTICPRCADRLYGDAGRR